MDQMLMYKIKKNIHSMLICMTYISIMSYKVDITGQIGQDSTTVDDFKTSLLSTGHPDKNSTQTFEINKWTQQTSTAYIIKQIWFIHSS